MTKKYWIVLCLVILLGCALLFWVNGADERKLSPNDFYSLIEKGETSIDLTKVTSFEWTKVEVFGPYSTGEVIEDALDIKYRPLFGGIEVSETSFLLLFVHEGKIVKELYLSREYGDYYVKDNRYLMVE